MSKPYEIRKDTHLPSRPTVKRWRVCRMHRAQGGAPSGPANGRWQHGERLKAHEELELSLSELLAQSFKTLEFLTVDETGKQSCPLEIRTLREAAICSPLIFNTKEIRHVETEATSPRV